MKRTKTLHNTSIRGTTRPNDRGTKNGPNELALSKQREQYPRATRVPHSNKLQPRCLPSSGRHEPDTDGNL